MNYRLEVTSPFLQNSCIPLWYVGDITTPTHRSLSTDILDSFYDH